MAAFLERFTLWGSLYGVTLGILLTEGVHLPRAAAWAVLASSLKFVVVQAHRRIWRVRSPAAVNQPLEQPRT